MPIKRKSKSLAPYIAEGLTKGIVNYFTARKEKKAREKEEYMAALREERAQAQQRNDNLLAAQNIELNRRKLADSNFEEVEEFDETTGRMIRRRVRRKDDQVLSSVPFTSKSPAMVDSTVRDASGRTVTKRVPDAPGVVTEDLAPTPKDTGSETAPPKKTDYQRRMGIFADMTEAASSTMGSLESEVSQMSKWDFIPQKAAARSWLSPFVPETMKLYMTTAEKFIEGYARPASGATVRPDEWDTAFRIFIPIAGDTPAILARKSLSRQALTRSLRLAASTDQDSDGVSWTPVAIENKDGSIRIQLFKDPTSAMGFEQDAEAAGISVWHGGE